MLETAAAEVRIAGRLDLTIEPWDWPFARTRRAEIDAHFHAARGEREALWNGRVLMLREPRFDGDCFPGAGGGAGGARSDEPGVVAGG